MDGLAQAHGRLLGDGTIQFHFPAADPVPPPPPPPSWLFSLRLGDGTVLFWAVIAVVAVATLVVAVRHLRFRRGPARLAAATPTAVAPPAPLAVPRAALEEADVLAAAGRYGDAVHALLLRGVEAIGRQFPRALAVSHTSRDIARLSVLPDATRHAFAGLAERTERAVFARKALTRSDWDDCRALYANLLSPVAQS